MSDDSASNRKNKAPGQGIVRDNRGQDAPADKSRAQQSSSRLQHGESDPPLRRDRDEPAREDHPKEQVRKENRDDPVRKQK